MAKIEIRKLKFHSKTRKIIDIILEQIQKFDTSLTVRQIHYLLVGISEANHNNTIRDYQKVSRILTDMRLAGLLDWDKIMDSTRAVYKTESFENINIAINDLLDSYRKDRWENSNYYVEVWTEKKTLINQFYRITNKYDIHLASGGGFSSTSYIYEAVKRLYPKFKEDKNIVVLYFGDLDPSGDFMNNDIENRFKEWDVEIEIKRIALNLEHIEKYNLQRRFDVPAIYNNKVENKIAKDPRAKSFYEKFGELFQIELEALDPNILLRLLEIAILRYVDIEQQEKVKQVEKSEIDNIKELLG